jgi:hypothetical protein
VGNKLVSIELDSADDWLGELEATVSTINGCEEIIEAEEWF